MKRSWLVGLYYFLYQKSFYVFLVYLFCIDRVVAVKKQVSNLGPLKLKNANSKDFRFEARDLYEKSTKINVKI